MKYNISFRSNNQAYILVMTLLFLLVIQAAVLIAAAIVRYNVISSGAFRSILNQADTAAGGQSHTTRLMFGAPEGWDHSLFLTGVDEKVSGTDTIQVQCDTWRTMLKEQPYAFVRDVRLAALRPYVLFIVDDTESFGWSSGRFYDDAAVYLKRVSGAVERIDYDLGALDFVECTEGTYFRGSYGNVALKAPLAEYYGGAMPNSTYFYPLIRDLVLGTSLCEISIASISGGTVCSFSKDIHALDTALAGLHLWTAADSKLSEVLYQALSAFPDECVTDKHIVFVTDGLALNDGNLPGTVQDFDHDGNPLDIYYEGVGCHCLDDVGAYAASTGVHVHTMGPDQELLRQVAMKGAGVYLPDPDSFVRQVPFITQMPVLYGNEPVFLSNTYGRFNPPWLNKNGCAYYTVGPLGQIVASAAFGITGPAVSAAAEGSTLYCTTTADQLLSIDLASRQLNWVLKGVGGRLVARGDKILAGPDASGYFTCLNTGPVMLWRHAGEIADASSSRAYIVQGNQITAFDLVSGMVLGSINALESISTLVFDPGQNMLAAGTEHGTIIRMSQDLVRTGMVLSGLSEKILDLNPYHYHKQPLISAITERHVVVASPDAVIWSAAIPVGKPLKGLVMDSKLYLSTWEEGTPCNGIDTGLSHLTTWDAINGTLISNEQLMPGRAFGPVIDLHNARIMYANSSMATREFDISGLAGVKAAKLGMKIIRP